jgi:hypothetical protein
MREMYTKVRVRSANEGSGTGGWSLAPPVLACFLMDEEDIAVPSDSLNNRLGVVYRGKSVGTDDWKQLGNWLRQLTMRRDT